MLKCIVNNLFKLGSFYKGYKTVRATTEKHFEDALNLRRLIASDISYNSHKIPEDVKTLKPIGLAHCFIVYYKNQAVGTVSLFDLKDTQPRNSIIFEMNSASVLTLNNTYEIRHMAILKPFQGLCSTTFLSLIQKCIQYSAKNQIKEWLVSTNKEVFYSIKKLNKNVKLVSNQVNIKLQFSKDESMKMNPKHFRDVVCYKVGLNEMETFNLYRTAVRKQLKFNLI